MKKKSYAARLGALAVALTMMTASLMGGTLAKYTTEVTGTGTAVVAKWAIKAGDAKEATTITEFKLGQADSGVAADRIAPGTSGSQAVYIDLSGTEVATEVKVEIKVDKKDNLPKNFVMKDSEANNITFVDNTYQTVFTKQLSAKEAATYNINKTLDWEWLFETKDAGNKVIGDDDDKANGITPTTATFTVKVTATQLDKDPTPPTP